MVRVIHLGVHTAYSMHSCWIMITSDIGLGRARGYVRHTSLPDVLGRGRHSRTYVGDNHRTGSKGMA